MKATNQVGPKVKTVSKKSAVRDKCRFLAAATCFGPEVYGVAAILRDLAYSHTTPTPPLFLAIQRIQNGGIIFRTLGPTQETTLCTKKSIFQALKGLKKRKITFFRHLKASNQVGPKVKNGLH